MANLYATNATMEKKWDVFISYASEDRSIAERLALAFTHYHVRTWYDEFELLVGNSLTESINKGLVNSKFGIIILSKNFINKPWPEYELKSLMMRQIEDKHVILPIWHNVTKEEMMQYSPFICDIKALDTSVDSSSKIVLNLIKTIRPDIYKQLCLRGLLKQSIANGKSEIVRRSDIIVSPIKQSKLTDQQIIRARNIYYGIGKHLHQSLQEHIDTYELDLVPEYELQTWEIMNVCYQEFLNRHPGVNDRYQEELFRVLLLMSVGIPVSDSSLLKDGEMRELTFLWKKNYYKF